MTHTGFIAAIDLGTSKISGVIGRKNENNVISVLAYGSLPSENSIRRGTVYNIDKAGGIVKKLINLLENKAGRKIGKVYVSLGGQSVYTEEVREILDIPVSGIVTENMTGKLLAKAKSYKPDFKTNYAVADVEYFIDDKSEQNPVGVTGSTIEAAYKVVVGRPNLLPNIKNVIEKNHLQIAGHIVSPLASAAIALDEQDKELGCAFIDFGAGTTSLSVYKGGILRHMVVIPFGGRNITKDIAELNFVESEAEQIKNKFGKAKENTNEGFMFTSPFSSKPDVDLVELNKVIVLRLDEITANIKEQIRLSGFQGQLGAGVIITGGASQLKNIDLYLAQKLNMQVKRVSSRKSLVNNSPELVSDVSFTTALGMLLLGDEDCEKTIVEENQKEPAAAQKSEGRGIGWGNIFQGRPKKEKEKEPPVEHKVNKKKKSEETEDSEKKSGFFGSIFTGMFEDEQDDE